MKRNFLRNIAIILSVICIILIFVLIRMKFGNRNKVGSNDEISRKATSEIDFIDYNVIDAMNKLNNISVLRYKVYTKSINSNNNSSDSSSYASNEITNSTSTNSTSDEDSENSNTTNETVNTSEAYPVNSLTESENQDIDWNYITSVYENLNTTWPVTMQDLKKSGVNDDYLENVTVDLNGIAQSIINKDKNSCLVNFYNLYAQLPNYLSIISKDTYKINLYSTKLAILNAYTLSNSENKWNEMSSSIRSARENFYAVVSAAPDDENTNANLEKIYSMLQNLESSVALNNKNIFYMQYKNVMQELETL